MSHKCDTHSVRHRERELINVTDVIYIYDYNIGVGGGATSADIYVTDTRRDWYICSVTHVIYIRVWYIWYMSYMGYVMYIDDI